MMWKSSRPLIWSLLGVLFLVLFLVNVSVGSVPIPPGQVLGAFLGLTHPGPVTRDILFDFRLTKAVTCILAGGALSLGGLFMQTLFRNPLAGPDVFGLSSGAGLLVALTIMAFPAGSLLEAGPFGLATAASIGASAVFLVVLFLSFRIRDNTSLLLIGLMIGATTGSIVSVLQFIGRTQDQHQFLVWTFGSLSALDWPELRVLAVVLVLGTLVGMTSIKSLNAWVLGDHYARSLGVRLGAARVYIIVATCLLTGGVTAFCGPIAFVGIAVPHVARMLTQSTNHRTLIPAVLLSGASLMLLCDTLAQWPGHATILPINAITALIGAPIVILVILRHRKVVL